MEEQKDTRGMLEMMMQPAFCVKNCIITLVNQAARQLLIEPQTSVIPLLGDDAEEYESFDGHCLCLTLTLCEIPQQTSVIRMKDFDLFIIDQEMEQAELRAMALTAMNLREPLSGIMTVTEQLFPQIKNSDDPVTQVQISQINRRLSQLHRMVCNMTDAIQYASDTPARMSCQDVCAVVEEIFDHAEVLLEKSGYQLRYSGPREPIYSMICAERLERAVYNILSNSMKHAEKGSLIEATLTRRNNKLYLSIRDNGSGIPSEILGNLYRRFQRNPGIGDHSNGLGLGLVLVRGAAAAHGGTVLIDQPNGIGNRITMSLTIRRQGNSVRSNIFSIDYAGERDHGLLELSDVLPAELYF